MSGPRFNTGWALLLTSFSIAILVPFNRYSEKDYALSTQGFIFSSKSIGLLLLLLLRNYSDLAILRVGLLSSMFSSLIQSFLLEEDLRNEIFLIVLSRGLEGGGRALLLFTFLLRVYPRYSSKSLVFALSLSVLAQLAGLGVCMIFFSERVSGYLFLGHGLILLIAFGVARCSQPQDQNQDQRVSESQRHSVSLKLILKKGISPLLSMVGCQLAFHFYEPLLLSSLQAYFDYNKATVALFYLATILSMLLSGLVFLLVPVELDRKTILVVGPLVSGVGVLMSGPSKLLHLPITPYIVITGLILIGASCGLLATAVLSEVVQRVRPNYPRFMGAAVMRACIFVFLVVYLGGESMGHLLAGFLLKILGINSASDLIGIVCVVVGFALLIMKKVEEKERRESQSIHFWEQDEISAMLGEQPPEPRFSK